MAQVNLERLLERLTFLDPLADRLQGLIGSGLKAGGPSAQTAKDLLNGTWLGHPLHPALTDVPIGAWTCSTLLDVLDGNRGKDLGRAADVLVGIGCASGVAAAASGAADWHDSYGPERRAGLAHALLNTAALGLFGGSLLLRLRGRRRGARVPALLGYGAAATAAFLGGDLVFRMGTQVNRNAFAQGPGDWTEVAAADEIREGELLRRPAADAEIVLTRQGQAVVALGAVCSHAGGPLEQGELRDGRIVCPWHGSQFDLTSGRVCRGPASIAVPTFEVRVTQEGKVEVRRARP
jgi:nitrite reductase/ring-hydroxylating ferredoxin subunit